MCFGTMSTVSTLEVPGDIPEYSVGPSIGPVEQGRLPAVVPVKSLGTDRITGDQCGCVRSIEELFCIVPFWGSYSEPKGSSS